jgi:hypothetical protein
MDWNWWAFAVVPVAWFLQNCVHELSHLLVGLVWEGRKPMGFYPYPHKHNGKWYFARYQSGAATKPGRSHRPCLIAPFFGGLIWSALWTALLLFVASPSWRIFLLPAAITGLVDAGWWWRGYFWGRPTTDGKRWRYGR